MKYTPRLTFEFDTTMERGDRVLNILREIEETAPPQESESA
jgi:ribosome-binding factor A